MIQPNRSLIFSLDDRRFGVPLGQVHRVIRAVDCTPIPDSPPFLLGVFDFHGEILPVLNIRRRFGLREREISVDDAFVIVQTSERTAALMVDWVFGAVDVPDPGSKIDETILPDSELIEGVIQYPDGLVLIHNLDQFLSPGQGETLDQAMTELRTHGN